MLPHKSVTQIVLAVEDGIEPLVIFVIFVFFIGPSGEQTLFDGQG